MVSLSGVSVARPQQVLKLWIGKKLRNKQFSSFKVGPVLGSVVKSCAVSTSSRRECEPALYPVSPRGGRCLPTSQRASRLWDGLSCIQVTPILLPKDPEMQEQWCWWFRHLKEKLESAPCKWEGEYSAIRYFERERPWSHNFYKSVLL